MVRAFVAVLLDAKVRDALAEAVDALRACHARVAWVPACNMHLSVAFLGNVPRDMVDGYAAVLDAAVAGVRPFTADVRGVGTFGDRVVWAGVEAPGELFLMQKRVAEGVAGMGVPHDGRPYRPHITLGRIKGAAGDLSAGLRRLRALGFGTLTVSELVLMRSELRPTHAVYSPLHAARVAG